MLLTEQGLQLRCLSFGIGQKIEHKTASEIVLIGASFGAVKYI